MEESGIEKTKDQTVLLL